MRLIPDMSLSDVEKDLAHLGSEYAKVADADLDAMFIQVRLDVGVGVICAARCG